MFQWAFGIHFWTPCQKVLLKVRHFFTPNPKVVNEIQYFKKIFYKTFFCTRIIQYFKPAKNPKKFALNSKSNEFVFRFADMNFPQNVYLEP